MTPEDWTRLRADVEASALDAFEPGDDELYRDDDYESFPEMLVKPSDHRLIDQALNHARLALLGHALAEDVRAYLDADVAELRAVDLHEEVDAAVLRADALARMRVSLRAWDEGAS
jgi:hypothetical protein